MSSMMQFSGQVSSRGVHLQAYVVAPPADGLVYGARTFEDVVTSEVANYPHLDPRDVTVFCRASDEHVCTVCGKQHPHLWTIICKPAGMWGCWVVFRWHNSEHVPDLSVPLQFREGRLPRGAKKMTVDESSKAWHAS